MLRYIVVYQLSVRQYVLVPNSARVGLHSESDFYRRVNENCGYQFVCNLVMYTTVFRPQPCYPGQIIWLLEDTVLSKDDSKLANGKLA